MIGQATRPYISFGWNPAAQLHERACAARELTRFAVPYSLAAQSIVGRASRDSIRRRRGERLEGEGVWCLAGSRAPLYPLVYRGSLLTVPYHIYEYGLPMRSRTMIPLRSFCPRHATVQEVQLIAPMHPRWTSILSLDLSYRCRRLLRISPLALASPVSSTDMRHPSWFRPAPIGWESNLRTYDMPKGWLGIPRKWIPTRVGDLVLEISKSLLHSLPRRAGRAGRLELVQITHLPISPPSQTCNRSEKCIPLTGAFPFAQYVVLCKATRLR